MFNFDSITWVAHLSGALKLLGYCYPLLIDRLNGNLAVNVINSYAMSVAIVAISCSLFLWLAINVPTAL